MDEQHRINKDRSIQLFKQENVSPILYGQSLDWDDPSRRARHGLVKFYNEEQSQSSLETNIQWMKPTSPNLQIVGDDGNIITVKPHVRLSEI